MGRCGVVKMVGAQSCRVTCGCTRGHGPAAQGRGQRPCRPLHMPRTKHTPAPRPSATLTPHTLTANTTPQPLDADPQFAAMFAAACGTAAAPFSTAQLLRLVAAAQAARLALAVPPAQRSSGGQGARAGAGLGGTGGWCEPEAWFEAALLASLVRGAGLMWWGCSCAVGEGGMGRATHGDPPLTTPHTNKGSPSPNPRTPAPRPCQPLLLQPGLRGDAPADVLALMGALAEARLLPAPAWLRAALQRVSRWVGGGQWLAPTQRSHCEAPGPGWVGAAALLVAMQHTPAAFAQWSPMPRSLRAHPSLPPPWPLPPMPLHHQHYHHHYRAHTLLIRTAHTPCSWPRARTSWGPRAARRRWRWWDCWRRQARVRSPAPRGWTSCCCGACALGGFRSRESTVGQPRAPIPLPDAFLAPSSPCFSYTCVHLRSTLEGEGLVRVPGPLLAAAAAACALQHRHMPPPEWAQVGTGPGGASQLGQWHRPACSSACRPSGPVACSLHNPPNPVAHGSPPFVHP